MLQLVATEFQRFMTSGRTDPAIFGCADLSGLSAGEFVVKLRGGIESAEGGLVREFIAAALASHFQLFIPEPALVRIEEGLARLVAQVQPAKAARVTNSIGLNFGTRLLAGGLGGFSTWPVDRPIPTALLQAGTDIFAFDALVQNPDRRIGNPNLLSRGEAIAIFDHEMAFSFLLDIFPSDQPWLLGSQTYLAEHVFYRQLKSKAIDLEWFTSRLQGLSGEIIRGILSDIPPEWMGANVQRIKQHLTLMQENAVQFSEEIRRFLI